MLGKRDRNASVNESKSGYHVTLVLTVQQDAMRIGRTLKHIRN